MNSLADYQRDMLDLIKGRPGPDLQDPHLALVADSRGLVVLKEIAVWWRAFAVDNHCVLTSRLLKKLQVFDQCVEWFYRSQNVSPYNELAGEQFLLEMSRHTEPLVRAVAQFELALHRVKQGDASEYCIIWDRDPAEVFDSLTSVDEIPLPGPKDLYHTYISRNIPGLVRCELVSESEP
jgi:hypothetical protein